jgi:hypothetical protein
MTIINDIYSLQTLLKSEDFIADTDII